MGASLNEQILAVFDDLTISHRSAARWILDHPEDVALLSMREQAKRAGVPAATMTRLAQRLGYSGYEALRAVSSSALRQRSSFSGRTADLQARREVDGDEALTSDLLSGLAGHIRALSSSETLAAIARAADIIVSKERLFCMGSRSSYASAHLGAYLLSLIGENALLVEGTGATSLDRLRGIDARDALLAVTIAPYTRVTVEAVGYAQEKGAAVIAITDSPASPVARLAPVSVVVPTSSPSFLQTVAPSLIAVESIAALVAARRGRRAVEAMAASEEHLTRFGSYYDDK
ncbi:MAG: MurR/RpiR family transcriptional regulator [Proteobacteria bacterium]|nr:MurR/RpiR family transcriptional regulator [Pseudomonadota bacterium]